MKTLTAILIAILAFGCSRSVNRPSNGVTLEGTFKYDRKKEDILTRLNENVQIEKVVGDAVGPFREPQSWLGANHLKYQDSKGEYILDLPKDTKEFYFQADHYQDREGEPLIVIKKIQRSLTSR
jgi:hypothetical protein